MIRASIVGVAAFCAVAFCAPSAQAYTLLGWDWNAYQNIPVWLHPGLDIRYPPSLGGGGWSSSAIENEIKWMLLAAQDHSDADLPHMYVAGWSSGCSNPSCTIPNAIHIVPIPCGPAQITGIDIANSCNSSPATGININIPNSTNTGPECQMNPSFYVHSGSGSGVLTGVVMHELGHVLGLSHGSSVPVCVPLNPITCSEQPCALMDIGTTTTNHWHWYRDDSEGLRYLYGPSWHSFNTFEESTNGISWYTLSSGIPPTSEPLAGASSRQISTMYYVGRAPTTRRLSSATWNWYSTTWTPYTSPSTSEVFGQTGAAYAAFGETYALYQSPETPGTVYKSSRFTYYTSPTSFLTGSMGLTSTRRRGASGAYDPSTGLVLSASRSNSGQILISVINGTSYYGTFLLENANGTPLIAYDTPGIACGPATLIENCVLVWADPGVAATTATTHQLRWQHFRMQALSGGNWDVEQSGLMGLSVIMHSTPQVAYVGPSSSAGAFVLTYRYSTGGDTQIWMMRKTTAATANWTNPVVRATGAIGYNSGTLGAARGTVETAELMIGN